MPIRRTLAISLLAAPLGAQLPRTLLVIQAEPDTATPASFSDLRDLVAAADARGQRLTLELSPQWASLILAEPAFLADLDAWRANGHEVGAHHHDPFGPLVWDGYTDLDPAMVQAAGPYLGTMADFKALLDQLVPGAGVRTGGIGGSPYELPYGLPFLTRGPTPVSQPVAEIHNRYRVWRLTFRGLASPAQLPSLFAAHAAAGPEDVVGVGTHVKDFAAAPGPLTTWMDHLAAMDPSGATSATASDVLGELPDALEADAAELSAANGGAVELTLRSAPSLANAAYVVGASLAGSAPGIEVGGAWNDAVHVGLNPDPLTETSLALAGTPWFAGFAGTLDAAGGGTAVLDTLAPLPASLVGSTLTFAFVASDLGGIALSSNPAQVAVVP